MPTILVTGGAGFIGGCFVREWLQHEHGRVVVLDKLTYAGNLESLQSVSANADFTFYQGGIEDRVLVESILDKHQPHAVVNFAAETHVDRSIDGPSEFVMTNVVGTFQLLETTNAFFQKLGTREQQAFRFLHISTDEVFGSLGPTGKFSESSAYHPNSPYSASKAASDHFVRAYQRTYGLPTLTVNCSNNYGPFQFPEKLIPLMILNAFEGKRLPVYGDGSHVRDWLYVTDHCQAIRTVLSKGQSGEIYNVGGGQEITNLEVVQSVCREVERQVDRDAAGERGRLESLIEFVEDRPGHDERYAIDFGKIQRELGWTPSINFATGLRLTVSWYLDHPQWIQRIHDGTYQRQRLGLSSGIQSGRAPEGN